MFGANTIKSGLTLSKVLGGISKTLSIANQVIPLYQQAKPMINNAKTIIGALKDITSKSTSANNISNKDSQPNLITDNSNTINNNSINTPVFFQ